MVSNGNHPLDSLHYDDVTLEEYALGQLLPDEENEVRQHLAVCASCRASVSSIQDVCRQIKSELHETLDSAQPSPRLSFDRIADEWHHPPRRISLTFRMQQLAPSVSTALLLILFIIAFWVLVPGSDATTLHQLDLVSNYSGPPSMVAAVTEQGLSIVQLTSGNPQIIAQFDRLTNPRNLQFSPDGRWLALRHGQTLHIIETRASGQHARISVHESAEWAWSPDSQALAYTNGMGQLAVFDVAAQSYQTLVPLEESAWGMPVWTGDAGQIAYSVVVPLPSTGEPCIRQSIWRVAPTTGYRVELARNANPADTLLAPATWIENDQTVLVWDMSAGTKGNPPALFRVNVASRQLEVIDGYSYAQGTRLAWTVSSHGTTLVAYQDRLIAVNLETNTYQPISDQVPRPNGIDWAPNGAWVAYTTSGMAEGDGVYLFAPQESLLRPILLPEGAIEKAVFWAGPEHLFVIRQSQEDNQIELWLVPLTSDEPPQRILDNIRPPLTGSSGGWRWQDVLSTQTLNQ